jgi:cell division septum initiation protein DivIVA
MPDDPESQDIARRSFDVARRGYEPQQVRGYLHELASLVDRLQREARDLKERSDRAEARLGLSEEADEAVLMEVLGEETTRVLTSAREAASEIRSKAEAAAERIVGDATTQAAEVRAEAVRDADRRVADAKSEADTLLESARAEHERRTADTEESAARIAADAADAAHYVEETKLRRVADGKRLHETRRRDFKDVDPSLR